MVVADQANFVRTVLRITGVLTFVNAVSNIAVAIGTPLWQNLALTVVGMGLFAAVPLAQRTLRRGEPARALTQLYVSIFIALGLSIPLVYGNHTLIAVGLTAMVLTTAPVVFSLAQVDRWAQATVALSLVSAAFDIIHLPTQLPPTSHANFGTLMFVSLAVFGLLAARNFRRYPVKTKLTLAFLSTAMLPLLAVSYLRPLPPGADGTTQNLLALAFAAGATGFAFALGRLLATPLSTVARAMGRFTAGDIAARAEVRVSDEIGEVASRFNTLAEGLGRVLGSLREEVAQRTQKEIELQAVNVALATARDQATAASRAKSAFLAQMSHELRTPLNAIIGYAELIAEDTREPAVSGDAERVLVAARHLLGIISDILDLSRVEAGHIDLQLEDVDAVALARDTCATVQTLMERSGNHLRFLADASRLTIRADARKLRQVLLNILSNAAKFSRDGEVLCEVRGEPSAAPEVVALSVRDQGIGIAADRIGALFQPFMQVDSTPSRRFDGTGLGLAISRHFCEAMGGEISVQSTPGRGSTFTVRLPVAGPPQP